MIVFLKRHRILLCQQMVCALKFVFSFNKCGYLLSRTSNIRTKVYNMSAMSSNYVYVALPDQPLYLKKCQYEIETESKESGTVSKFLDLNNRYFMVFSGDSLTNKGYMDQYIKSCISSHKVYRQSTQWNFANFAHSLQFSEKALTGDGLKRGVCIYLQTDDAEQYDFLQKCIEFFSTDKSLSAYELTRSTVGIFSFKRLTNGGDDLEVRYKLVSRPSIIDSLVADSPKKRPIYENLTSPIFSIPEISPVYHSYDEARRVLQKLANIPEVQELLDISDKHVVMATQSPDTSLVHPFIVVEGMDATGKTTLTEALQTSLSATRLFTPPPQITHLRAFFDALPEIVRRAYYSMGNYIVARDIIRECQSRPVIMDRFWHSTTAYGIANESSSGDLPANLDPVYTWPRDLIKPNPVVFLTVTEHVRKQRLSGRGIQATFEEKSLDKDQLFRQRLCMSYRRMDNPHCIEIDAGGSIDDVRNKALDIIRQRVRVQITGTD